MKRFRYKFFMSDSQNEASWPVGLWKMDLPIDFSMHYLCLLRLSLSQPFNEFKPIKRQIVPLIPQPALSHQHETCLLLFYRREAGCSTAYFELLLFFFIMILVSWRHIGIQWNHETSLNNFNSESNSWLSHFVYRPWVWIPV